MARGALVVLALGLACLATPAVAQAQESVRVVVAGGPTLNDLELSGPLWTGTAGVEWQHGSGLWVLAGSVHYVTYALADRRHRILPEISVQFQAGPGRVRPYLGGGGGTAWAIRPGREDAWDLSTHIAGGVRVPLRRGWGLRLEARLRSLEPLGELTLGVSRGV